MRMTIVLALIALAACGKEPTVKVENATAEQVAAEVKRSGVSGDMKLIPGEWQVVTEMKLVEAKGIPDAVASQMKQSMERTTTDKQCITPEQVNRPNSELFAGKENSNCKYENFEMGGGKIKALMHCPGANGAQMTMTMNGTYTPKDYKMEAAMDMQSPGSNQGMKMSIHSTGSRIGECAAGTAS